MEHYALQDLLLVQDGALIYKADVNSSLMEVILHGFLEPAGRGEATVRGGWGGGSRALERKRRWRGGNGRRRQPAGRREATVRRGWGGGSRALERKRQWRGGNGRRRQPAGRGQATVRVFWEGVVR